MVGRVWLKVSGVLAALVLGLIGIALVRTWVVPSRQVARPPHRVAIDGLVLATRLSRLLQYPTVTDSDGQPLAPEVFEAQSAELAAFFPRVHAELQRRSYLGFTHLYTWPGSDPALPPVMFIAHTDVVPADPEGWNTPPFAGSVVGENVCGRGAIDDKHNVLALFSAFEAALASGRRPKRTLHLLITHDEETAGSGAQAAADGFRQRGEPLAAIFDEGLFIVNRQLPGIQGPIALVGTAEKGELVLRLVARRPSGHAARPFDDAAIPALARVATALQSYSFGAQLDPPTESLFDFAGPEMSFGYRFLFTNRWLFGGLLTRFLNTGATAPFMRTTLAPTVLRAGDRSNVIPGEASLVVNLRLHPRDTPQGAAARIEQLAAPEGVDVELVSSSPPSQIASTGGFAFQAITDTLAETFPGVPVAPALFIAASDSRAFQDQTANIYRFSPLLLEEDEITFHGTNECITQAKLVQMVRYTTRLVERLGQTSD